MKNKITNSKFLLTTSVAAALFLAVPVARASFWDDLFDEINSMMSETSSSSSQVVSQLEVRTETGNNVISNNSHGEVTEGEQKAEITIEQTVNGEEIEPVHVSTDEGKALVVQETKANGDEVNTEQQIQTGEEANNEELNVDNTPMPEEKDSQVTETWWEVFLQGLASVFENLFNFF